MNGTSGSGDDSEDAERVQAIRGHRADYQAATQAGRELLEEARRHRQQFRAQQAAAVAGMAEQGLSRADIAEVTGLTRREITAALNAARAASSRTASDAWDRPGDGDRHQPANGARDDSGHTTSTGTHPQNGGDPTGARGRDHEPAERPPEPRPGRPGRVTAAHRRKDNRRGPPDGTTHGPVPGPGWSGP